MYGAVLYRVVLCCTMKFEQTASYPGMCENLEAFLPVSSVREGMAPSSRREDCVEFYCKSRNFHPKDKVRITHYFPIVSRDRAF